MRLVPLLALSMLAGCVPADPEVDVSVQRLRAGNATAGTYLSLNVLATQGGQAIPCSEGEVDVSVRVSSGGADGPWTELDTDALEWSCADEDVGNVALVVDNSGSEQGYLDVLRDASSRLASGVHAAEGGVSVVRVSTNAEVLQPVSDEPDAVEYALQQMFIENGWTALWDGIRMGNETLGAAHTDARPQVYDDLRSFCSARDALGIVAFTDGRENNSADQQSYDHDRYPGDGIDTTLDDLRGLTVDGVPVPIYTIGLGDDVDHSTMAQLAAHTGGRHQAVQSVQQAATAFEHIEQFFQSSHRVCTQVPTPHCGSLWVEVDWSWARGNGQHRHSETEVHRVEIDCPHPAEGRVATVLLTLSDLGVPADASATLATNAVDWTSPSADPQVLVVLDDNHHGEYATDAGWIADRLEEAGYTVTYLEEPDGGLTPADVAGFDVVWMSNPGYPIDDAATAETLDAFGSGGGGVVLQGDDMGRSFGEGFDLSPFHRLDFEHNGVRYCGVKTDDNEGASMRVSYVDGDHPLIAGLAGTSFLYGDDIDRTHPRGEGEQVLAWATLADGTCDVVVPTVVALDPNE